MTLLTQHPDFSKAFLITDCEKTKDCKEYHVKELRTNNPPYINWMERGVSGATVAATILIKTREADGHKISMVNPMRKAFFGVIFFKCVIYSLSSPFALTNLLGLSNIFTPKYARYAPPEYLRVLKRKGDLEMNAPNPKKLYVL